MTLLIAIAKQVLKLNLQMMKTMNKMNKTKSLQTTQKNKEKFNEEIKNIHFISSEESIDDIIGNIMIRIENEVKEIGVDRPVQSLED